MKVSFPQTIAVIFMALALEPVTAFVAQRNPMPNSFDPFQVRDFPSLRSVEVKHEYDAMASSEAKQSHRAVAILFSGFLFMCGAANPALAETGDLTRGQELFELNCAGCHGGGQNYVKPAKTLQQDALRQFLGGSDQSTIESFVKTTSRQHQNLVFFKMPGGKLTDQQYADVTSYVSDQATQNKWEPVN